MPATDLSDLIDDLVPLTEGSALHAVRHQRAKVVAGTQGSHEALFDPALPGLGLAERLLVALRIADLSGCPALVAHYRGRLQGLPVLTADEQAALAGQAVGGRLQAVLAFASTLTIRPVDGDQAALLTLPAAGLQTADVVALAQSGKLKPIPVECIPARDAYTALMRLQAGQVMGRLVLEHAAA